MQLERVDPRILSHVWPLVSGWLAKAIEKGDRWWTLDGLAWEIAANDDCALFLAIDRQGVHGAAVVMIEANQSGERYAHFPALGGVEMKRWFGLFADIEAWAKSNGATELRITGRPGWRRVLRSHGYRPSAVILEKAL